MFTRPTKTLLVVVVLGALLVAVPAAAPVSDGTRKYEAVAFEPSEEPDVLTHGSSAVANLTSVAADNGTAREQLDRAAAAGSVTVDADGPLSRFNNDTDYAVYEREYYRLNASSGANDTYTLQLRSVTADHVLNEVGVAYADTRPDVQRVVDDGTASVSVTTENNDTAGLSTLAGFNVPPVVVDDGTHYRLRPADGFTVVDGFLVLVLSKTVVPALQRLGVTYLCVAGGVAGLTQLRGRRDVVTPRRAAVVVGGLVAVQAAVVGTVQFPVWSSAVPTAAPASELFGPLAAELLLAVPPVLSTLPVAVTLLVGVVWGRDGVGSRLDITCFGVGVALAVYAVVAGLLAQSVVSGLFAFVVNSVALVTAVPVVAVGYIHAATTDE